MGDLLLHSSTCHAKEAKDHAIAFIGVYRSFNPSAQLPPLLEHPDYEVPLLRIFRDATRFVLEESCRGLNPIFRLIEGFSKEHIEAGWPSWVPR